MKPGTLLIWLGDSKNWDLLRMKPDLLTHEESTNCLHIRVGELLVYLGECEQAERLYYRVLYKDQVGWVCCGQVELVKNEKME